MKRPVFRTSPEKQIENAVRLFLSDRGWLVEKTHSTAYSSGWPDLYLFHREHGHRWVDIKVPARNQLTKAQCQKWPVWEAAGIDVHIITGATETEYAKLFRPANWREFWRPAYDRYVLPLDDIMRELDNDE